MSHLTLQLGSSLVAPIAPPRWKWRQANRWRLKAWREARLTPGDCADVDARLTRALALWRLPSRPGAGLAMKRPALVILAAGLLLAGCAGTIPVPATVATPGMPNPEEALRQSMTHVDAEMAQLGVMAPGAMTQPTLPEDLQRIVSFKWSGSLDQGVAKLAQSIGYTFFTTAPEGAQTVNVAVEISSVPAYQAFQTLGQQAGTLATVQVDPIHHQVQVIHHA